ncbi:MAG TPA: hypothetical protein ENG86_02670, partial [Nitrospirae bacterium]|nr:hypothetical protein [Nitrospirota bacterium]
MADRDKEIELLKGEIRRLREEIARLTPPLETLLKIRRYYVYKRKPAEMPLLPEDRFIDKYYNLLGHYSFRLFIRDVIKFQDAFSVEDVTRYTAGDVTKHYISILKEMRLVESSGGLYRLVKRPVRSFGPTLEWFVSGIFEREF